jgi:hypothetical protein
MNPKNRTDNRRRFGAISCTLPTGLPKRRSQKDSRDLEEGVPKIIGI